MLEITAALLLSWAVHPTPQPRPVVAAATMQWRRHGVPRAEAEPVMPEGLEDGGGSDETPMWKPPRIDEGDLSTGQVVQCTVLGKLSTGGRYYAGYVVDIGASKPALVPRSHVILKPNATVGKGVSQPFMRHGWAELPKGMVLDGQIMAVGDTVNVSFARAQRSIAWERVRQLAEADITIDAKVLRLSEAGATLDVESLPAFLPWSHWLLPPAERTWRVNGMTIPIKFLEVDQQRSRLVVSNRRVEVERAIGDLAPGMLVEGTVRQVKPYGAVIALDVDGGAAGTDVTGLLHVSQISQAFVEDVGKCVAVGDAVRSVVIKVDSEDGTIELSTKRLELKPGDMIRDPKAVYERAIQQSSEAAASAGGATDEGGEE